MLIGKVSLQVYFLAVEDLVNSSSHSRVSYSITQWDRMEKKAPRPYSPAIPMTYTNRKYIEPRLWSEKLPLFPSQEREWTNSGVLDGIFCNQTLSCQNWMGIIAWWLRLLYFLYCFCRPMMGSNVNNVTSLLIVFNHKQHKRYLFISKTGQWNFHKYNFLILSQVVHRLFFF